MKILAISPGISIDVDDGFIAGMMCASALRYILKDCNSEELAGAIRKVAGCS